MKEAIVIVKWTGDADSLIQAVNRFGRINADVHHISILSIKEIQTTPMKFYQIWSGQLHWVIAASSRESALKLWKLDQGWLGQLFHFIRTRGEPVTILDDSDPVALTDMGYQHRLAACDLIEYAS